MLSNDKLDPCLEGGLEPVLEPGLDPGLDPPGVKVDLKHILNKNSKFIFHFCLRN